MYTTAQAHLSGLPVEVEVVVQLQHVREQLQRDAPGNPTLKGSGFTIYPFIAKACVLEFVP